jgi:hypothetical protein
VWLVLSTASGKVQRKSCRPGGSAHKIVDWQHEERRKRMMLGRGFPNWLCRCLGALSIIREILIDHEPIVFGP